MLSAELLWHDCKPTIAFSLDKELTGSIQGCCDVRLFVHETPWNRSRILLIRFVFSFQAGIIYAYLLCSIGLGELTFLQLSTTYAPPSIAGHSVGYVLHTSIRLCETIFNGPSGTLPQEQEPPGSSVRSYGGKSGVLASEWELGYHLFVVQSRPLEFRH